MACNFNGYTIVVFQLVLGISNSVSVGNAEIEYMASSHGSNAGLKDGAVAQGVL